MEKYNVSRETYDKLKAYETALKEWQNKFNLVSNSSLDDAWNRHFKDSVQLFKYIPEKAKIMLDFGSGAGFPGMVLAILASEKMPALKVRLIESIKKKTVYLNAVKELCGINVQIINDRIENLHTYSADVITSRAMCNLNDLLFYANKFSNRKTVLIFPKGKSYKEELSAARKNWDFECNVFENEINPEGVILVISNLSANKGGK